MACYRDLAEMVRNPERYREKMEAMDLVRKRQQEQYEAAARLLAERAREKKEEKRRQRLQELENLVTIHSFIHFSLQKKVCLAILNFLLSFCSIFIWEIGDKCM